MNDSYENFLAMSLFAEVSGMNAENDQRKVNGESMAYIDVDYYNVLQRNRDALKEYHLQMSDGELTRKEEK